jgi:hypothetical protein
VQRQHHIRRRVHLGLGDAGVQEGQIVPAETGRDPGVVLPGPRIAVDTRHPYVVATRGEQVVRREREVGVPAAQVDHPQRPAGVDPAALDRLVHGQRELLAELFHLAELGLPGRLHPAAVIADPELGQERRRRVQQPVLDPVVAGVLLSPRRPAVQQRAALLGVPQLQRLAGGLDVPVAVRRGQQLLDPLRHTGAGSRVGGVRLPLVVRRDLQVPARLEVDVAQLHPLVRRRVLAAAAAGADSTDQRGAVEEHRAELVGRLADL